MTSKCGYCNSENIYFKMATCKHKSDGSGWVTKRYNICRKCRSVTIEVFEYDTQKCTGIGTEVYLEDDVDYTDINELKIKPDAVMYDKEKENKVKGNES